MTNIDGDIDGDIATNEGLSKSPLNGDLPASTDVLGVYATGNVHPSQDVTLTDDIDAIIRDRVQAELAEHLARRERLRAVRRDFNHRRRYAKTQINRERLERSNDQPRTT